MCRLSHQPSVLYWRLSDFKEWREEFDGWIESNQRKHAALILVATWQKKRGSNQLVRHNGSIFPQIFWSSIFVKEGSSVLKRFDLIVMLYLLGPILPLLLAVPLLFHGSFQILFTLPPIPNGEYNCLPKAATYASKCEFWNFLIQLYCFIC